MRTYSSFLSVNKNSRGIYSMDTVMGCASGMANESGGCYGECYSAKAAKVHGYDFSQNVLRRFKDRKHKRTIITQIKNSTLPFIRIGSSGDPSEDWGHTINILGQIAHCNKKIVIITRHWNTLTDDQLHYLSGLNICINTSVSTLDKPDIRSNCLSQYHRIKPFLKSVLRVVTCNFNHHTIEGLLMSTIQKELLSNVDVIDTVLRVNKRNRLLNAGIINAAEVDFIGRKQLASKHKKTTYLGKCSTCFEQCGVRVGPPHLNAPGIINQLAIF